MNWTETTTAQEEQFHYLWLAVEDKGYHQEGPDRVADTVAAAVAVAGKAVAAGYVRPKVI